MMRKKVFTFHFFNFSVSNCFNFELPLFFRRLLDRTDNHIGDAVTSEQGKMYKLNTNIHEKHFILKTFIFVIICPFFLFA